MLIFVVVCAIGVPLMLWALSPGSSRKPAAGTGHQSGDPASLPPANAGRFDAAPNCDAGAGGCDTSGT